MPILTELQHKAIQCILNMIETGELVGQYDTLVVLDDGAGITFGKTQTTENGGGLAILLNKYIGMGGVYANHLRKFMPSLYFVGGPSSRKSALTENTEFRNVLIQAAKTDPKMRQAQDDFFYEKYYKPALVVADQYDLQKALSVAVVYDSCIHSGEGDFLEGFDDSVEDNGNPGPDYGVGYHFWQFTDPYDGDEEEESFISAYLDYREKFLATRKALITKRSVYRIQLFRNLIAEKNWDLNPPLNLWWDLEAAGLKMKRRRVATKELLESL